MENKIDTVSGRAPAGQALVSDGAASVSTLTGFDPSRAAGAMSAIQRAIVTAASKENDFRQAWYFWRAAGLPGFANGREVVNLIKPTGCFEKRMGGAQVLVWKLNERGKAVAIAIETEGQDREAGLGAKPESVAIAQGAKS